MHANYEKFIDRVIDKYEGGYGWDKADGGGPTKYGITCYDLAEFQHETMSSMSAWAPRVKAMSLDTAEVIYEHKYAGGVRYDDLPSGVDCCMLDYGINSGVSRAVRVARALLNQGTGTRITDNLVTEIQKSDPTWFIDSMCKERMHFLKGLKNWGTFHGGWTARVTDLEGYCEHLVGARPFPPTPVPLPKVPKGEHKPPPVGPIVTGGTTAGGAGGAAVHAAGLPPWVIFALVAAGVVGGLSLVLWQRHKAMAANAAVVLPPTIRPRP